MMSGGIHRCGIFIYSGVCMGDARKRYLRSNVMNFVLLLESEMILLRRIFVSNIFAAGNPVSYMQVNLSIPMTNLTLYSSDLSGL